VIKRQFGFQKTRLRGHAQEPLQSQCAGSSLQPVYGAS
jgi:hypothetical protein